MRTNLTLSVMLLSAMCATPAFANFFYNPYTNINLNVGSAPSPTPREVRENHLPQIVDTDPSRASAVAADATTNTGHAPVTAPSNAGAAAVGATRDTGNPAVTDHASSQSAEGETVAAAQLSH